MTFETVDLHLEGSAGTVFYRLNDFKFDFGGFPVGATFKRIGSFWTVR